MTKFLLIRHGMTDTVGKSIAGRMPGIHLNEIGKAQVQKLAERMAHLPIKAIYSSPLERTLETAAPLSKLHNLEAIPCDDFLEIQYGEWTNRTIDEIKGQTRFHHYNAFRSGTRVPGGEAMFEVQLRVVNKLHQLKLQHPDQLVAVVSHGDVIRAAVAYYAGVPLDLFLRLEISPASVSVVEIYEETAKIIKMNDTVELKF